MVSKDDSCTTSTRVRHSSDDPPPPPKSPQPMASTETAIGGGGATALPEFRSNVRSPPPRLNLYRRTEYSSNPGSPRTGNEQNNNHEFTFNGGSNGSKDGSKSPKPFKRETWLQRSWRVARTSHHRPSTHSTCHLSTDQQSQSKPPPLPDRSISDNPPPESGKKSPSGGGSGSGNPLTGLLERLRHRSDTIGNDRLSLSRCSRRKKGWTSNIGSPRTARSPAPTARWVYERRGSSPFDSPTKEREEEDLFGSFLLADRSLSPVRRKRSSSDTAKYIIMRKTSRPNTAEVVGSINRRDIAYKQLLKKFTCYDLMPTQGALVAIDSQLTTRLALTALADNGVRAGFLWDSRQQAPIGFVTVTDFLRIMYSHFSTAASSPESDSTSKTRAELDDVLERPIVENLTTVRHVEPRMAKRSALVAVSSEDTLLSALTILLLNRLHRIAVLEVETNNPLYLLSSKRLLQFLYEYMHRLPMSMSMYKSLEDLRIGTWITPSSESAADQTESICSVSPESSMAEVLEMFLHCGASSLPVLEAVVVQSEVEEDGSARESESPPKYRLIDALTKVDLMHFVLVNGWSHLDEKTVVDVLEERDPCMERLITCHRKTLLALAIDRLVSSQAHRLYVVDSDSVLQAIVSIGDLLAYLNDKANDDSGKKN